MLDDDLKHVGRLLRAAVGLKGDTIAAQMRRGGRLLPRGVRAAAQRLAVAEGMIGMPKLAQQLDNAALSHDYKTCVQYLAPMARGAVRQPKWLRILSWAAWIFLAVLAVIAALYYLKSR